MENLKENGYVVRNWFDCLRRKGIINMKNLCAELMKEVEKQGELSPCGRERIWKMFEVDTDSATARTKRIALELNCLQKVMDSWEGEAWISPELQDTFREITEAVRSNDKRTLDELLPDFYDECEALLEDSTNFYEDYLKQSIRYLMAIVEDIPFDDEAAESIVAKNSDLEFDERDTSYCACMMWAYQKKAASDVERKRKELEFWDWYIKEAAKQQGLVIEMSVKIPERMMDVPKTEINSIEDFVKYISHEFDFIRYEKKENKVLFIYVTKLKDGAYCTKCGKFSSHIKSSVLGIDKLGKMKGWAIEFGMTVNSYYCDNPECSEKRFYPKSEIGHQERVAHFSYLKSIPGMPEKICELFGIG